MGLKLKKTCNLLNTLLKHDYEVLSVTVNSQAIRYELSCQLQNKEACSDFNSIQKSMDIFSELSNGESIKNTMMKHEEIFQQQVRELHRLYQVQKTLMIELNHEKVKLNSSAATSNLHIATDTINKLQSSRTSSETTHSSRTSCSRNKFNTAVLNSELTPMEAGHSSPELINCSETFRSSKRYNLQTAFVEGESPESCSNGGCNLDLTLSIGSASEKMKGSNWKESTKQRSSNLNREENGKERMNSSSGFGAESLKRPHWLFQALSLNKM